jgi:hypothetical protein
VETKPNAIDFIEFAKRTPSGSYHLKKRTHFPAPAILRSEANFRGRANWLNPFIARLALSGCGTSKIATGKLLRGLRKSAESFFVTHNDDPFAPSS